MLRLFKYFHMYSYIHCMDVFFKNFTGLLPYLLVVRVLQEFNIGVGIIFICTLYVFTEGGLQMFLTAEGDFFNRTFQNNQYFYCKHCKTYNFYYQNESVCGENCTEPCFSWITDDNNKTECSSLEMKKSVIFIGNPSKATSKLCMLMYLVFLFIKPWCVHAQRELIVVCSCVFSLSLCI